MQLQVGSDHDKQQKEFLGDSTHKAEQLVIHPANTRRSTNAVSMQIVLIPQITAMV
jgi:hypothetical protein